MKLGFLRAISGDILFRMTQALNTHQRPSAEVLAKPTSVEGGLFRLAFHNSPALQSVLRAADGVIVEVNDTFLQKMNRTREQVIGKTPLELNSWVEPDRIFAY